MTDNTLDLTIFDLNLYTVRTDTPKSKPTRAASGRNLPASLRATLKGKNRSGLSWRLCLDSETTGRVKSVIGEECTVCINPDTGDICLMPGEERKIALTRYGSSVISLDSYRDIFERVFGKPTQHAFIEMGPQEIQGRFFFIHKGDGTDG